MGKFLRVMVVVLFFLGIAALVLEFSLFRKRDVLTGLPKDLAAQVVRLAGSIEAEQSDDLTQTENPKMDSRINADQLLKYKTDGEAGMEAAMGLLVGKAQNQLTILNDTRTTLGLKMKEVEAVSNQVASLEETIARAEEAHKNAQEKLANIEKNSVEKESQMSEMAAEVESSRADVADLKDQVAKLNDDVADKEEEIKSLESKLKELGEARSFVQTTNTTGEIMTTGTKGKILLVNKGWNFVVIGLDSKANVAPGIELTIQRDSQLVGKVRVSDVNPQYQLAIADVMLAPWKQSDPEVGDNVFY